ncbi:hypothetical protein B8W72_10855 [Pseudomonas putida]|uniref:DUF4468 domain-containing protein n=1 Tax=Pseudomonas putida TaxID=303 RepID=A0A1Y3LAQ5_PSEPU|nr:DUF4468 domain-containing protein [Pseudomonas putida]OUM34494.1 hypothetical protein B8W72_10855 [Pseudomonas putida]
MYIIEIYDRSLNTQCRALCYHEGSGLKKIVLVALAACSLAGCVNDVAFQPMTDEQREFTYDYKVPGKTKVELFKNARNYLATAYGDSKAIGRVEDEGEGLIIAKAVTLWKMDTGMVAVSCVSGYDISFIAKDEKARLQLTINKALQSTPECGWKEPSKQGYPEVVSNLNATAKQLGEALEGRSKIDKLKDF